MKEYLITALVLLTGVLIGINTINVNEENENINFYEEGVNDLNNNDLLTYTLDGEKTNIALETLMNGLGSTYVINNMACSEGTNAKITKGGKITFTSISNPAKCVANFSTKSVGMYLVDHVLDDNLMYYGDLYVPTRTAFYTTYKSNDKTFFKTNNSEHGDTVYYYAGNATNNWVIFGTCKDSTYNCTVGHDLYWRIIRTNEDATGGGVRLLYSGSGSATAKGHKSIATTTNGYIKATAFNATTSSSEGYKTHMDRYVGYMYGTSGYTLANIRENTESSTIKGVIDAWYTVTFTEDKLKERISKTAVYCNDRSYTNSSWYSSGSAKNDFGAYGRLNYAKAPSYACGANSSGYGNYFTGGNDKADKFSAEETTYGNGLLSNPVALMTADEAAFAGGKYNTSLASPYAWYYLNAGAGSATGISAWWTMSPGFAHSSNAYPFYLDGSNNPGRLYYSSATTASYVARPVLSLNSETLWLQGDGTANDPYRIVEN